MDSAGTWDFDVRDVEYLRHGDKPLLARLFVPRGPGPFPAVVHLHGGAWNQFDRTRDRPLHEALARSGITVMALDFRDGRDGGYPLAMIDINYAVRWAKAHAADLKTRPELIGLSGNSSGGHLAALAAMRPRDVRYTAIALPEGSPAVDATVRCAALFWPVINPHSRYRKVLRQKGEGDGKQALRTIHHHDLFWPSLDAQEEASPLLMVERGEAIDMPPMIWVQTDNDDSHNYRDAYSDFPGTEPQRFAARYAERGGGMDLRYYDAPKLFVSEHPEIPASLKALGDVAAFVHRQMAAAVEA
jgi:acetyl esterase/lipase